MSFNNLYTQSENLSIEEPETALSVDTTGQFDSVMSIEDPTTLTHLPILPSTKNIQDEPYSASAMDIVPTESNQTEIPIETIFDQPVTLLSIGNIFDIPSTMMPAETPTTQPDPDVFIEPQPEANTVISIDDSSVEPDSTSLQTQSSNSSSDEYEVIGLLGRRETESGLFEYQVQWADKSTTWEPEYNLNDTCQNLIDELNSRMDENGNILLGRGHRLKFVKESDSTDKKRLRSNSAPTRSLRMSRTISKKTRPVAVSDSDSSSSSDDPPAKRVRHNVGLTDTHNDLHLIDSSDDEDMHEKVVLAKLKAYFEKVPHWHKCFECGLPPKAIGGHRRKKNSKKKRKTKAPFIMCDQCFCSYHHYCLIELKISSNGKYPHMTSASSMICPGCITSIGKSATRHKKYDTPLPCMYCPTLVSYRTCNSKDLIVTSDSKITVSDDSLVATVNQSPSDDTALCMQSESTNSLSNTELRAGDIKLAINKDSSPEDAKKDLVLKTATAAVLEPKDFPSPLNMNGYQLKTVNQCQFRCLKCKRGAHWPCAVRAYQSKSVEPLSDWAALYDLLKEGTCWVCNELEDGSEVQTILAYRPIGSDLTNIPPEAGNPKLGPYEMLFKFVGRSYRDVKWVPQSWFCAISLPNRYTRFVNCIEDQKVPTDPSEAIDKDWLIPYKVLDFDEEADSVLVQWKRLTPSESTWESLSDNKALTEMPEFVSAMDLYARAQSINSITNRAKRHRGKEDWRPSPKSWGEGLTVQPKEITGGVLMAHQLEGLSWLIGNWCARWNCLLSDEMGLGKTIQLVTFLNFIHIHHERFPFLVVVPNSTLDNWAREFKKWAPNLHVVSSWGSSKDRDMIAELELFWPRQREGLAVKCHVVLATYESVLLMGQLKQVHWDVLVVDEGHRLKNDEGILFKSLQGFKFDHRVLLTGTPLQNNLRELFNIMQFLEIEGFDDPEKMAIEYDLDNSIATEDETGEVIAEKVRQLHEKLRPHLLRRIKTDVVINIPPKAEILVPVRMSPLQRQLIRDLYSRSFTLLKALGLNARMNAAPPGSSIQSNSSLLNGSSLSGSSLLNLMMQCRKTLSHPFVMNNVEEGLPATTSETERFTRTIDSCGKFALLAKMLPKLQQDGHKVLIFSQFRMSTVLIGEFLDDLQTVPMPSANGDPPKPIMRPFLHYLLDGSTERVYRQQSIDEFNDNPNAFAFVLSTRAGGVGINLTAADTCIIYDVDWNPHLDIQAIARCHRIGQTKPVLAFKFMTVESVEEKMIAVGRKKLALDHVIVQRMGKGNDKKDGLGSDLLDALKFGAFAVLSEDYATANSDWQYTDEEVTRLLDRTQAIENAAVVEPDSPESSSKSKNTGYGFSKVWLTKKTNDEGKDQISPVNKEGSGFSNVDEVGFGQIDQGVAWDAILEKLKDAAPSVVEPGFSGPSAKRKRKEINYSNVGTKNHKSKKKVAMASTVVSDSEIDTEFVPVEQVSSDDDEFVVNETNMMVEDGPQVLANNSIASVETVEARMNTLQLPPVRRRVLNSFGLQPNPIVPHEVINRHPISATQQRSTSELVREMTNAVFPPPSLGHQAKMNAQSTACWVCRGTKYEKVGYHVPTQCPAIQNKEWVIQELDMLRHKDYTSTSVLMDRNRSTFLCMVLESWESENSNK